MLRVPHRLPAALALVATLGLSACAVLEPAYGGRYPYPAPAPRPSGPVYGGGDYRATPEWRTVDHDAARYAREAARAVRLDGRQERSVERVVRDRARDLLQRTRPQDHRYVYPFPRDARTDAQRRWWDGTDRAVERALSPRQRDDYRRFARGGGYYDGRDGYDDRDGRYDDGRRDDRRGDDRYPGRRYESPDTRRGDRAPASNAPAFCRDGRGHPTQGMRWCTERGYARDRDDDRRDDGERGRLDSDDDDRDGRRARRGDDDRRGTGRDARPQRRDD